MWQTQELNGSLYRISPSSFLDGLSVLVRIGGVFITLWCYQQLELTKKLGFWDTCPSLKTLYLEGNSICAVCYLSKTFPNEMAIMGFLKQFR